MNSYDPCSPKDYYSFDFTSPKHMLVIPQKPVSIGAIERHDLVYKPIQTHMGNCHTKRIGNN